MGNKRVILAPRKSGFRRTNLTRYLIVVDTEQTEFNYLNGIKNTIPVALKDKIEIQVKNTTTDNLVEYCLNERRKNPNMVMAWIVFDRDRIVNFDEIVKDAVDHGIYAAWSNPCIETWFFSYYGKPPSTAESTICVSKFKERFKHENKQEYKKNDKRIYQKLNQKGSEIRAIKYNEEKFKEYWRDKKKPSEMIACSTLYKLVSELVDKIKKLK